MSSECGVQCIDCWHWRAGSSPWQSHDFPLVGEIVTTRETSWSEAEILIIDGPSPQLGMASTGLYDAAWSLHAPLKLRAARPTSHRAPRRESVESSDSASPNFCVYFGLILYPMVVVCMCLAQEDVQKDKGYSPCSCPLRSTNNSSVHTKYGGYTHNHT